MIHALAFLFFFGSPTARALAPLQNGGALVDDPAAVYGADVSARWGDVSASARPDGSRSPEQRDESVRNLTVRGAWVAASPWAVGAEVQLADRARAGDERSTNLSEFNANVGRRDGPVLSYLQLTTPVSRSAYELENQYQLDALGRGFWAVGLGQLWTLEFGSTSVFATYEIHRSWPRPFANSENAGRLVPGFGANWAVGVNQKIDRVTLGLTLPESYEDPVRVEGDRDARAGSAQRFFTPTLSVGAELGDQWTVAVTWADQTILPAASADLMRELGVSAAKSW